MKQILITIIALTFFTISQAQNVNLTRHSQSVPDTMLELDFSEIPLIENQTNSQNNNQSYNNNSQNNVQTNLNTITDIDGNTYKVVTLGTQTWMAENLRVTKYNNGTEIPKQVLSDEQYSANRDLENSQLTGYIYPYSIEHVPNDVIIKENGLLYSFYVVQNGNVCPQGFRLPTSYDFTILWSSYINDDNHPVPAVLKPFKEFSYPYEATTGGYYKRILVKCSNCSYWTEQQKQINPCSVCKNKRSWYVNGDYVPKTTFTAYAEFNVGFRVGTNSLGLSLDARDSHYWTNSELDWGSKTKFHTLYIHQDGTVFYPNNEFQAFGSGSFYRIRCIKND
jgi:uncharacterized protein (TIGR02145 family)